jgi:hypothetical protein
VKSWTDPKNLNPSEPLCYVTLQLFKVGDYVGEARYAQFQRGDFDDVRRISFHGRSGSEQADLVQEGHLISLGCDTSPFSACRFLRIPSPNAKSVVEISYDKPTADYPDTEIARIPVKTDGKLVGECYQ